MRAIRRIRGQCDRVCRRTIGSQLELFRGDLPDARVTRCMKKGLWTISLVFRRHGFDAGYPTNVKSDDHPVIDDANAGGHKHNGISGVCTLCERDR